LQFGDDVPRRDLDTRLMSDGLVGKGIEFLVGGLDRHHPRLL
jgi:hypothetical protein